MEIELLWLVAALVLAVAAAFFAMGWFARGREARAMAREAQKIPDSYFQGLNQLVSDSPDAAIAAFTLAVQEHPQTAELEFALATLFRRRGEIDRAIRLHQDLAERVDLAPVAKERARLELARDFVKAGLLDHAERALLNLNPDDVRVVQHLHDIYVQERDWAKAIAAAERLSKLSGEPVFRQIGHYHCELAMQARQGGDREAAQRHLVNALVANPQCVRATLLDGEWLALDGRHEAAIATFLQVERQNPEYIGLAARAMFKSYVALGQGRAGLAHLRELQPRHSTIDFFNVLFEAVRELEGDDPAYLLVKEELRRNPTLVGLDRLLEAQMAQVLPERRADLSAMKDIVATHAAALSVYLCNRCGFRARHYYWRCPACNAWESLPPKRTAELETAEKHLARISVGG
jgi:lipopolysaccharide assembly protein B